MGKHTLEIQEQNRRNYPPLIRTRVITFHFVLDTKLQKIVQTKYAQTEEYDIGKKDRHAIDPIFCRKILRNEKRLTKDEFVNFDFHEKFTMSKPQGNIRKVPKGFSDKPSKQ